MIHDDDINRNLNALEFFKFISGNSGFNNVLERYEASLTSLHKLKTLHSQFNSLFAEYGWIATDETNVPLMESAIDSYKHEGLEAAEMVIMDCFSNEYIEKMLPRMNAIFVYKVRERLIKLALEDHKNERYHASVPVVLCQLDGLIFDIAGHSFYENNKKSDKFDYTSQMTGFKTEIQPIANKMNKQRGTTTEQPLSFPYRNGILHGRDLAYDNKLVSTKCFFNLLAIRPWVLFIQNNEISRLKKRDYIEIPNFKMGEKLQEHFNKTWKL